MMYTNPYAWNKHASIIYLESPGSVGFSTASTKYRTSNDTSTAKDNLKALQMFF
jgi:carboxypeptidase C (cathepsin A)